MGFLEYLGKEKIASNYDAGKSGFHAESRVRALFFSPGYSQNPIFN
jgi:hypothetical protein